MNTDSIKYDTVKAESPKIDLNCDMGESFGVYRLGSDEEIMPWVTSVNIACGFHAGDPATMRDAVACALRHGTAIGAHPGLPDLQGFGRRTMKISAEDAYAICVYQIGALQAFASAEGARLQHVKPHGALYNMAAKDRKLAEAIAEAVYRVDPSLILFGPSGSELLDAGNRIGLRTASEVFADRTYQEDGSLTPRDRENAVIADVDAAVRQVIEIVTTGKVRTVTGALIPMQADTVCLHGDGAHAVLFAKTIHQALERAGIRLACPQSP
jgi:UPF0271 protein